MVTLAIPKFAAQAIRKIYDIGWKPIHFLTNVSVSVSCSDATRGLEKGMGIISAGYIKEPTDPQWHDYARIQGVVGLDEEILPIGEYRRRFNGYGYRWPRPWSLVLKQCGDNLTRDNLMKAGSKYLRFETADGAPASCFDRSQRFCTDQADAIGKV